MLLLLLALVAALVRPSDTEACATAPPVGEEVRIAQEEAIIIWDRESQTEHFIRRAGFTSSTERFGFLVPTPAIPELAEVQSNVFDTLARRISPDVRREYEGTSYELGCALLMFDAKDGAPAGAGVRVLGIAHVAGYDASILQASDSKALSQWLGAHGFEASAELEAWLDPYVRNKWTITAFEVAATGAANDGAKTAGSAAVAMSFVTTRPFYPYREPASQQRAPVGKLREQAPSSRLLRVFFLGDERVDGQLGAAPWPAEVIWAAPITHIPDALVDMAGERRHLTVFHDETSPRQGVDEVWFVPAADLSEKRPEPIITKREREELIPLEPVVLLVGVGGYLMWRRRRRRR